MSQAYSLETRKIIEDCLSGLRQEGSVSREFVERLSELAQTGMLDSRSEIRKAVAILEAEADEL